MFNKFISLTKKFCSLFLALFLLTACSFKQLSPEELNLSKDDKLQSAKNMQSKQNLHLAIPYMPKTLKPELAQSLLEKAIIDQVYEGLVSLHNNRIRLQQAESIEANADYTVWTIRLRDDLRWSDGSKLTAHDYRRSWLEHLAAFRTAGGESYRAWIISQAEEYSKGLTEADEVGIKVDGNTLILHLNRPVKSLPAWLTQNFFYPTKNSSSGTPLFNGAYLPTNITANSLELSVNEHYWDAVNVWLKKVYINVIKDEIAAYEAYHNGDIDFIGEPFYPISKNRRQAAIKSAESLSFPLARLGYIKLNNLKHPLFTSSEKRMALYELLDAPFQANVLLQDSSKAWPERATPSQSQREQLSALLKKDLSQADLNNLTEQGLIGVGGSTLLENRLLISTSKDWLNALKIRFHLKKELAAGEQADFSYCVDLAPNGDIDSLLQLWILKGEINLNQADQEKVWSNYASKSEQQAHLQKIWHKLPEQSNILPLTTRNSLVLIKRGLIGLSIDKTGKMLLSDLQWR